MKSFCCQNKIFSSSLKLRMLIQIHLKQDLLIILCQFVRFSVVDKLMYCAQNGLEFGSRNNELLSVLNSICQSFETIVTSISQFILIHSEKIAIKMDTWKL